MSSIPQARAGQKLRRDLGLGTLPEDVLNGLGERIENAEIIAPEKARQRHMHIVGFNGSGKSRVTSCLPLMQEGRDSTLNLKSSILAPDAYKTFKGITMKQIWRIVSTNPFRYLLGILCIVVGVLQFFGLLNYLPPERVMGLILSFLGVLALSTQTILQKALSVAEYKEENSSRIVFESPPDTFTEAISDAKELWVVGVSVSGFIENNHKVIERRVAKGKKTVFVLVDPESTALEMVSMRDQTATDCGPIIEYQRARIQASIDKIKSFPVQKGGCVELWLSSYPIDSECVLASYGAKQTIFFRHFPYKTAFGGELRIAIDAKQSPFFPCYKKHLENIRDYGHKVN